MNRLVVFCAVAVLFSACNFGFMDKNNDGIKDPSVIKTETTTFKDVEIRKVYKYASAEATAGTLQYIEQYWVETPESDSRRVDQIQRFSASGVLEYTKIYTFTDTDTDTDTDPLLGKVESYALYGSNNKLQYFSEYEYCEVTVNAEPQTRLLAQHEYTSTEPSALMRKSSLLFQYEDSGKAAGQIKGAAYFGPDSDPSKFIECSLWYFLPDSELWNMKVSSITKPSSLVAPSIMSVLEAKSGFTGVSTPTDIVGPKSDIAKFGLPSAPVLAMPTFSDLKETQYSFQYKDDKGSSVIDFNSSWYPQEVARKDSRLSEIVRIRLVHDTKGRITSKKTFYGSTLALQIDVSYDNNSRPLEISASGAAMTLPVSLALDWNESNLLNTIIFSTGKTALQYFVFSYKEGFSLPSSPNFERLFSIDPFSLVEDLFVTLNNFMESEVVISHYDIGADHKVDSDKPEGDDTLLQTFVFSLEEDIGAKITVYKPSINAETGKKVESLIEANINGTYSITYTNGLASKITASNAKGEEVWAREFGYSSDFFTSLVESVDIPNAEDLQNLADSAVSLYETRVPASAKTLAENATLNSAEYLKSLAEDSYIDLLLDILF